MKFPRIMLAGLHSGCGKTTVTCALMKALKNRGMDVAPFKCGPDYIDPMFHRFVTGNISANLDSIFADQKTLTWILTSHGEKRDIGVMEGVMGYYDGQGVTAAGSAWDVAVKTKTPVILIARPSGTALSLAAMLKGYLTFKQPSMIAGVILNGIREGMYSFYRGMIEEQLDIPVLGFLPEEREVTLHSRHLGLVTAQELSDLSKKIERMGEMASATLDMDRILSIAKEAAELQTDPPERIRQILSDRRSGEGLRLAVARDPAFSFYYEDNLALLAALGVNCIPFSPMADEKLPEDIHGLYIGGGYPEIYAKQLSKNRSMRACIRKAVSEDNIPAIAECGGYMYLGRTLKDREGQQWAMCGSLPCDSEMTSKLGPFGYVEVELEKDCVLGKAGNRFIAHEFHYSRMRGEGNDLHMEKGNGKTWTGGHTSENLYGAYPHLYFYGAPELAAAFVGRMAEWKERKERSDR